LVIWVLALLALLAGSLAGDVGGEARLTRNRIETARARALAEAGVTLALNNLLLRDPSVQWPADGRPRALAYDGGTITVTIQDEGGKVDLNAAPVELLASLFDGLGIGDGAALARTIVDYRERAAAQRPAPGAPKQFGLLPGDAGSPGGLDVRAMPFAAVSELRQLPGVSRAVYDAVRPFVTVYSASRRVNPRTAPREVLLGLPGVSPQEVGFALQARRADAADLSLGDAPALSGVERYVQGADVHAATVSAAARAADGGRFVREAVVILTDAPLHPFQIVQWRQAVEGSDELPTP
jgi:general secretion pathway protein K